MIEKTTIFQFCSNTTDSIAIGDRLVAPAIATKPWFPDEFLFFVTDFLGNLITALLFSIGIDKQARNEYPPLIEQLCHLKSGC
jgi:hypothetical protein